MFKVLAHPHSALSPGPSNPSSQELYRLLLSFFFFLLAAANISAVTAQNSTTSIPTNGFSVLVTPATNAVLTAGSSVNVSVDISAGSDGTVTYNSLEIYLVSATTNMNVTVASGTQLLSQDSGSNVKTLQWPVATCLPSGDYNLTLYEGSSSNGTGFFAITPIPMQVQNNGTVDVTCSSQPNPLQAQPQPSDPPPAELIASVSGTDNSTSSLPASASTASASTASGSATSTGNVSATITPAPSSTVGGGIITITASDGEITIPLSDLPGTIVIEPSGGAPPDDSSSTSSGFITVFKTVTPTATATLTEVISEPVTVTLEETFVSTFTQAGQTLEFTVTQTLLSTVELVTTQVSSPEQAGLLPVNSASKCIPSFTIPLLWSLSASLLGFVLSICRAL